MEAWRRDEETGQAYSLKLTDAGLKAIPADERGSQSIPSTVAEPSRVEKCNGVQSRTASIMESARAPSSGGMPLDRA